MSGAKPDPLEAERAPVDAYVSLGSNLGDRAAHLAFAVRALGALPATKLAAVSPIYETAPVGPPPQGPYLNAVAKLRTGLSPRALLAELHAIEARAGRVRGPERNAARTLDLDLLLHGEQRVEESDLAVPHPRLAERAFVLEPLCDLAPTLRHPTFGDPIEVLASRVRDPASVRLWPGARNPSRPAASGRTRSSKEEGRWPSSR